MPENKLPENKLQIRAKLLSAIINLQNNTSDISFVGNTLDDLNTIQDKDTMLEILHKELLKENSEMRDYTISFLLNELVEKEKIEKSFPQKRKPLISRLIYGFDNC